MESEISVPVQPPVEALSKGFYASYCKRFVDLCAALPLFICCLPIIAVAALLIILDDKGAPFYGQKRVGVNGKVFTLYKLRSMHSKSQGANFETEPNDMRITKSGALLRDKKIDELPQLWNVIRGEMSLIGPRPLSVEETEHIIDNEEFTDATPGLIPRLRPGMTGLEQCTRRSLNPYWERFIINRYYEVHSSLWLDLYIIKKTLFVCPSVCLLLALSVGVVILLILWH